MNRIVLASASIGRRELFEKYFGAFDICVSDFDEESVRESDPHKLAEKLALGKARSVARLFNRSYVMGFDTIVLCEGKMLGKPADKNDAIKMLKSISGKKQSVISGFAIINKSEDIEITGNEETVLVLKKMSDSFIENYVVRNEVTRFAGGYGVQDNDRLIEIISGSFENVIGAPMELLLEHCRKLAIVC
jgi:septum formation protein